LVSRVAAPGFIRIWCGAHQLDLAVNKFYEGNLNAVFYSPLTSLISFLRRQQIFEQNVGSKCPKVCTTRWLSLGNVTQWIRKHRHQVLQVLEEKNPSCVPAPIFWLIFFVVDDIAKVCNKTFRKLQYLTLQIPEQEKILDNLVQGLKHQFGAICCSDVTDNDIDDSFEASSAGTYAVPVRKVQDYIEDMGLLVRPTLQDMTQESLTGLCTFLAREIAMLLQHVSEITVERDANNTGTSTYPSILPYGLANMRGKEFSELLVLHANRLASTYSDQEVEEIEEDFHQLKFAYQFEDRTRYIINKQKDLSNFKECWAPLFKRFTKLHNFVGGFATVFPGTSSVESDFSQLKWSKDANSSSLTDFSLEGILHSKQFFELDSIFNNH